MPGLQHGRAFSSHSKGKRGDAVCVACWPRCLLLAGCAPLFCSESPSCRAPGGNNQHADSTDPSHLPFLLPFSISLPLTIPDRPCPEPFFPDLSPNPVLHSVLVSEQVLLFILRWKSPGGGGRRRARRRPGSLMDTCPCPSLRWDRPFLWPTQASILGQCAAPCAGSPLCHFKRCGYPSTGGARRAPVAKPCLIFHRGAWGCSVIRSRGADQMPLCQAPARSKCEPAPQTHRCHLGPRKIYNETHHGCRPRGLGVCLHICCRRVCWTSTMRCGCGWGTARSQWQRADVRISRLVGTGRNLVLDVGDHHPHPGAAWSGGARLGACRRPLLRRQCCAAD